MPEADGNLVPFVKRELTDGEKIDHIYQFILGIESRLNGVNVDAMPMGMRVLMKSLGLN